MSSKYPVKGIKGAASVSTTEIPAVEEVAERTITCAGCGLEFPHPVQRGRPPKFCSEECRRRSQEQALRDRPEAIESPEVTSFWDRLRVSLGGSTTLRE